jgi:hypothetical protein
MRPYESLAKDVSLFGQGVFERCGPSWCHRGASEMDTYQYWKPVEGAKIADLRELETEPPKSSQSTKRREIGNLGVLEIELFEGSKASQWLQIGHVGVAGV